jgi:hypothetical protein
MTIIAMGATAVDRDLAQSNGLTYVALDNPAIVDGELTSVELWCQVTAHDVKVGVFYNTGGTNFKCRAVAAIGTVNAGSKQTFSIILAVLAGDYIGNYSGSTNSSLDISSGGQPTGYYYKAGDHCVVDAVQSYSLVANRAFSCRGIGASYLPLGGIGIMDLILKSP